MSITTPPRIEEEVQAALGSCRRALDTTYPDLPGALLKAPADSEEWYEILRSFPESRASWVSLRRLGRSQPPGRIEHYALLHAFLVSLPLVPNLPLEDGVKHQICQISRSLAFPPKGWEPHFDLDCEPFYEMAKIATLRRFPAGQLTFDIEALPRSWLLKIHPLDLPAVVKEILFGMGGFAPVVAPHLFHWRANPLVMLKAESERSLWRIAKSIEKQPEIKGLAASSWFYSIEVGAVFPHLGWLRAFFVEQGATLVDMEPAPLDSGFLVGSLKRKQLYDEGLFHPRRTLVLWRRADMLAWAAAHPELGDLNDLSALTEPPPPPTPPRRVIPRRHIASGSHTLWDGIKTLNNNPKLYILLTLIGPDLLAGIASGSAFGWGAALPGAVLAMAMLWVAQYFLFQ